MLGLLPGSPPAAPAADVARREQLLKQLGGALEAQDPYLDGHSRRVARYATTVARRMGLPKDRVKTVRAAAAVHDVGKLRVAPGLLRKSAPLTEAEFEAVMRHADEGAEMVACLGNDELTEIVRHHHERFDGLGYPAGLRGTEIPLGARIVAVADTFDAITSVRPYRPAARHKQAIDVLIANAGTQLDPHVVRTFLRYYAGRKAAVLWVILAVSPQRAFAWVRHGRGSSEPVPAVPVGELAAGTIGRALVVAAAVGTSVGVAHYEDRVPARGAALQIASAAPFSLPLTRASAGGSQPHGSAGRTAARQPFGPAVDTTGPAPRPPARQIAKGSHDLTSAPGSTARAGSLTGPGSATGPGGTVSPVGGGGGVGSAPAAAVGPAAGASPVARRSPHNLTTTGGGNPPAPTVPVQASSPSAATPAPATPAPSAPPATTSGPPSTGGTPAPPTPPPPGPTGGGSKHNGPGDGGWGPGGRPPHNGPRDGGYGPGGNPNPGPPR
jgi:hypothetical protein